MRSRLRGDSTRSSFARRRLAGPHDKRPSLFPELSDSDLATRVISPVRARCAARGALSTRQGSGTAAQALGPLSESRGGKGSESIMNSSPRRKRMRPRANVRDAASTDSASRRRAGGREASVNGILNARYNKVGRLRSTPSVTARYQALVRILEGVSRIPEDLVTIGVSRSTRPLRHPPSCARA